MFRKVIAAAASVIMLTAGTSFTAFAADEEKVVAVYTAADLYDITADTDKVYLRADIDLSGYEWDGIKEFSGVFYGNGNSIRNMKSDSCGLFYSLGTGANTSSTGSPAQQMPHAFMIVRCPPRSGSPPRMREMYSCISL